MSEQNTTPAAAPAKPKRPKSKSQLMAGALLDKAYNDAIEAKARGGGRRLAGPHPSFPRR